MWNVFIPWYLLPICFDRCRDHHQGNLQEYYESKQSVKMHKCTSTCNKDYIVCNTDWYNHAFWHILGFIIFLLRWRLSGRRLKYVADELCMCDNVTNTFYVRALVDLIELQDLLIYYGKRDLIISLVKVLSFLVNKSNRSTEFLILLVLLLYMFRAAFLPIIRSS
jgi:hypothetical protein